jgi:hypothetical protein
MCVRERERERDRERQRVVLKSVHKGSEEEG